MESQMNGIIDDQGKDQSSAAGIEEILDQLEGKRP
jgi:hypothetical protein